jgi:hypothetical protein
MRNKLSKILSGVLTLAVVLAPQLSYADWGVGINFGPGYHRDAHFSYRWHDHPRWGWRVHYLPQGYLTIRVGGARYFYYDGLYYTNAGGEYVLVTPPVGASVSVIPPDFQPVIINARTYYTNNGVYYILTRQRGYRVVAAPVIYAQPQVVIAAPAVVTQDAYPVNVPNNSGGYVTVVIKRSGHGFMGPQGEFYRQFPAVTQLKVMYGR